MDLKAPAPAVSKSPKKTVRRSTKIPGTPPAVQQSAPAVVVEVREEKKRRLNPLWLLILLLLLLICCCGLLLTDAVEVPEFIAPYINPIIDNFRPALPDFDDGGQVDKPEIDEFDCEEFQEKVRELDAWGEFDCDHDAGICTTTEDITGLGLEDYEDIEILYEWDDLGPEVADCDGPPKN